MRSTSSCSRLSSYMLCDCRGVPRLFPKERAQPCRLFTGLKGSLELPTNGRSSGCGRWWSCNRRCGRIGRMQFWAPHGDSKSVVGNRSIGDGDLSDMDTSFVPPKKRATYSVFAARLAIMVMLTILIGLLTILTWHFTTVYTTRSIKTLAFSLRTELLQRPIARMWNLLNATLDTTVTHVNLSRYVVGQYNLPISPDGQDQQLYAVMRNVTWAIFTSRKAVNALTIVYSNGVTQRYERDSITKEEFYCHSVPINTRGHAESPLDAFNSAPSDSQGGVSGDFVPVDMGGKFTWYKEPVDYLTGQGIGPEFPERPYNLTQDLGGTALLKDGDNSWRVTVHRSGDSPFLASGSPVRHPETGEVLAVAGVTQTLRSVSQLMEELVTLHTGTIYLTNSEGWLLASSTSTPLLKNTSSGPSLIRADESTDSVIRAGATWLSNLYGTKFENLQSLHEEDVVLLGKRYYIDTFFLNLTKLPLVGVIITPRSFVMGAVDRRGHATLAILISISVCILVAGCLFTLIFTTGVSNEMKLRSELIDHLDARRRAEASSNYKSQFLANMSHELRTPMAAVIGLLDILLCDEYMTSEQVAMVSQIRDCSTALLRLLNNILDLSKVESGKLVLEEADFDLRRELEGLVDMFSVQCVDHSVEIVLDLADDVPRVLRGDSARTVQIFANLIANSIKFTLCKDTNPLHYDSEGLKAGHVLVRGWVDSACHGKNGALVGKDGNKAWTSKLESAECDEGVQDSGKFCLWFEVDDTGCGIDPSKWETVFDSFVQADPSTTRTHGGTGLGLCIVKSLVNKMGGDIKVVRKESRGTLLKFSLFYNKSSESDIIPKTFRDFCASTFFSKTLQNSKLLFSVEGHAGRTAMSRWIQDNGLQVSEASTWEETVSELEGMVRDGGLPRLEPLAILDISLISQNKDLELLEGFTRKGVLVAWLLNHDTSSTLKGDLRKRGFSIMANKPVYKSKLVHLLKMLVGCSERGAVSSPKRRARNQSYICDSGDEWSEVPWRVSLNVSSPVMTEAQSELTRARLHPLRANSCGRMEQILEHKNHDDELLLSDGHQRHHSEEYSIYPATSYLKPVLERVRKPTASATEMVRSKSKSSLSPVRYSAAIPALLKSDSFKKLPFTESCRSLSSGPLATDKLVKDRHTGCNGKFELARSQNISRELLVRAQSMNGSMDRRLADDPLQHSSASQLQRYPLRVDIGQKTVNIGIGTGGVSDTSLSPEVAEDVPVGIAARESRSNPPRKAEQSLSGRIGPQDALKGIRILLAEDTPVLQRVATMMLEKLGASVSAVGDGLQAVNALTVRQESCSLSDERNVIRKLLYSDEISIPYDLVLMDCQMPKLDGYDATRAIREAEKGTGFHIPIVALTAHAMSSDEAKCLEVGMDAYLTKPIDPKLMMTTITSLTQRQRAAREVATDSL